MATFEETLQEMQLGGLVLPVSSRTWSGGRDFQRTRQPYRAGQRTTDTGRQPYTWVLEVPLFHGVDADHWPGLYGQLVDLLNDEDRKGEVDYIDPVLGPFQVKVVSWREVSSAQARHGAAFEITLEENSQDEAISRFTLADSDPSADARALAALCDELIEEAGLDDDDLDAAFKDAGLPRTGEEQRWTSGSFFAESFADYEATVTAGRQRVEDIASEVERIVSRVESVMALEVFDTPALWPTFATLARFSGAVVREGAATARQGPRLLDFRTSGVTSIAQVAAELYGDASRVEELLDLNALANPLLIPAGTTLRVPSS